ARYGSLSVRVNELERETCCRARNGADMGCGKVRRKKQRSPVRAILEDVSSADDRVGGSLAEPAVPRVCVHLNQMMHHISTKEACPAGLLELQNDMTRRMAGRRLDEQGVVDLVGTVQQHGLSAANDWKHAVLV